MRATTGNDKSIGFTINDFAAAKSLIHGFDGSGKEIENEIEEILKNDNSSDVRKIR